ncbi:MAG: DUF4097 family beta strand repeat protein [Streptosporangiales bacterium]|nr:DUF4097 family beta strand repeat protein [Streptosporangiales bacterium]
MDPRRAGPRTCLPRPRRTVPRHPARRAPRTGGQPRGAHRGTARLPPRTPLTRSPASVRAVGSSVRPGLVRPFGGGPAHRIGHTLSPVPQSGTARRLTLAAVLGLGIAAVGYFTVGSQRSETHTQQITEQVTGLDVTGGSGDVEVVATSASQVTVTETLRYGAGRKPTTQRGVTGQTLRLSYTCRDAWLPFGGCNVDYRVEVPAELALKINAGSGDVTVRNLDGALEVQSGSGDVDVVNAGGPARLTVGSGDVEVEGARGDLTVKAGSGSIEAEGLAGRNAAVRSGSGDLELVFARPPGTVTAETGSGDAKVELPGGSYNVSADSDSGDEQVEVSTDPAAPNTVDVSTGSGDVQVTSD